MKVTVNYRDAGMIVLEKETGIATYGEASGKTGLKELAEENLNQRLFPVHRIDADTSGIVIFALEPRQAANLIKLFKEHRVQKTYLAWCVGEAPAVGSFRKSLKKNKSTETESARTDFKRIKQGGGFSMLEITPFTGRYHQIRRHFAQAGFPLVGDPKYGAAEAWTSFFKYEPRLMLHASALEFTHPQTKKLMRLKSRVKF